LGKDKKMEIKMILPSRIFYGTGIARTLPSEIERLNCERPVFVISRSFRKTDFFKKLKNLFTKKDILVFEGVYPEPDEEIVAKVCSYIKQKKGDVVIGVGGGSVMDVAKLSGSILSLKKIMIPTTAGSGSEVTHEAVIKEKGKKRSVKKEGILADAALVDPEALKSLSSYMIAVSGLDALSHSVESLFTKKANFLTKKFAQEAYELIRKNISFAIKKDFASLEKISLASLLAGISFGNSGTTLCHALSYPFSNAGMSHGMAVALMLPFALNFNGAEKKLIREVNDIIELCDVQMPHEIKVDPIKMAEVVIKDKRHLDNNPVPVNYDDLVSIFKEVKNKWKA